MTLLETRLISSRYIKHAEKEKNGGKLNQFGKLVFYVSAITHWTEINFEIPFLLPILLIIEGWSMLV